MGFPAMASVEELTPQLKGDVQVATLQSPADSHRSWIADHARQRSSITQSETVARRARQTIRLFCSDAIVISCALLAGQFIRFDRLALAASGTQPGHALEPFALAVL